MPALDLPTLARHSGIRRKSVTLRPIVPTTAQASELATIILPAANIWAEAKAQILAGYVLPTADSLTTDDANDLQAAIDRAAGEFLRLVLSITPRLRNWTVRTEKWHRDKWGGAVKAATGVSLATVLTAQPVQETLETFINRNTALIRDVSAQTQGRIADIIFRNYAARTPIAKVAREIDEAVELGRKRAKRIAADQNTKLSAQLDRERQQEAGIEQFMWRHGAPAHPRPEHAARDGNVYSWNEPPEELPGELPNCTCRAQAYLAIMGELE